MLGYLKAIGAGLFVASLIILGFKIATWRSEAALLEVAKIELRNEIERRVSADADRLALQIKLSAAEARIGSGVRVVTKTIRQYVKDLPDCRIAAPASNGLRDLRAGVMPTAPAQPARGRAAP
jgi:hypothetical protein